MEKNLLQLWKIMNFNIESEILRNAKLLRLEFRKKTQTTYFTIAIAEILPVSVIEKLEKHLNMLSFRVKLLFRCNVTNYDLNVIATYWEYIKHLKSKKKEFVNSNITVNELRLENNILIIKVINETQKTLVTTHLNYYQTRLNFYGFSNLKLQVELVHSDYDYEENTFVIEEEARKNASLNASIVKKQTYNKRVSSSRLTLEGNDLQPNYKISQLEEEMKGIIIEGQVFRKDAILTKTNRWIYTIFISDWTDAISLRYFTKDANKDETLEAIKIKDWVITKGDSRFDSFSREQVVWISKIKVIDNPNVRYDTNFEKRIEFHAHTKMSAMDGVVNVADYIKQAHLWKHRAIAITDHLNVQSFPEAQAAQNKYSDVKVIYGVEMDLINSNVNLVVNPSEEKINNCKYVIFDIETTGLSSRYDEIIEFGAVVMEGKNLNSEKYDFLIKPSIEVTAFTESLTGITNKMLADKPNIIETAQKIKEVIKDAVLVAHNASFDMGFLQALWNRMGYGIITNPVIDTLSLSRLLQTQLRYHRLGTVARKYNIKYNEEIAHRADYDATVLGEVFRLMLRDLEDKHQAVTLQDIANINCDVVLPKLYGNHVNIIAKNEQGLKNLFNLVSLSHTKYFYNSPKITFEVLNAHRKDIFIGSGCVNGQIFETARNKNQEELETIMQFYDYIEVQPLDVYQHLIQSSELSADKLMTIIKNIIFTAKKLNKIIIATSDAHYLNPEDKIFRDVYISAKGLGGKMHPLYDRKGRVNSNPEQYLRTTQEMLDAFGFLGDENLIKELVITNPAFLNEQIAWLKPIKDNLYTPVIEDVDNKLRNLCYENAHKIYGTNLPLVVTNRLEKELNAILKHGFGVIYWIAHKLVSQSLNDGYLVGSRGSVGSSLVATMTLITEVNPLSAHYICSFCQYSEFIVDENIKSGYDLPAKQCPNCNNLLIGDGHDIPFETFLGFDGDKVPDIDLNFSGEYQIIAHNFTKEMFGEENVFRAGTISTVAQKTAFGYVKGYLENVKGPVEVRKAYIEWLAQGCEGVKRTTGQHPGGIIVVPKEYDVNDFSPINYPADDIASNWKTTHFDFHAIHDNLLKLDILGHVDPTALRMLHDLTGYDPLNIKNFDQKVLSLFNSLEALNINSDDLNGEKTAAVGLPEFGTKFVRKMLEETKPNSFAELVQISGLSHGTDVWLNNAQSLIRNQGLKLKDVIGCRDDIMTYLIHRGLPSDVAFNIMENVRKGKGINEKQQEVMLHHKVPEWYITSCQKIKYMFPKAHATAYVLMALRIAWYKINYPHEYYATYFTTRCDVFDLKTITKSKNAVLTKLQDINARVDERYSSVIKVSQKEKDLVPVLEVALEMYARNIEILNIDLEISEATKFVVKEFGNVKKIIAPFAAVDGLGTSAANSIIEARNIRKIASIEDLQKRTIITKTHLKYFEEIGILSDLARFDQLTLDLFS